MGAVKSPGCGGRSSFANGQGASCRVVVFMDQAAEDITAAELLGDQRLRLAIAF